MPSKPGEEPAGKELIASRTFWSLTIKEKSPGLKASGKKSSRDDEGCFSVSVLVLVIRSQVRGSPSQNFVKLERHAARASEG
jgi:hypothetical protein